MACPHVSGVVALVLSESPDLNPEEVEKRIVGGAQTNRVRDARDSPNRLLFMGNLASSPAPSTSAPTPAPGPDPSTSAPPDSLYTKLGDGFCRTASGARGTFSSSRASSLEACQVACSAQETCVGVEFQQRGICELHRESLARVSASSQSVRFVKTDSAPPSPPPQAPQIRFVTEISEG